MLSRLRCAVWCDGVSPLTNDKETRQLFNFISDQDNRVLDDCRMLLCWSVVGGGFERKISIRFAISNDLGTTYISLML